MDHRRSEQAGMTRRQLLQAAGVGGVYFWLAPHLLSAAPVDLGGPSPGKDLIVHNTKPWNGEPELPNLVNSWITPHKYFYVRTNGPIPKLDPKEFTLTVEGLVNKPLTLTLAELQEKYPQVSTVATMTCAGNRRDELNQMKAISGVQWRGGAIGNAEWSGVDMAKVLETAGIKPEAKHLWFEGADVHEKGGKQTGFGASIPLERAMDRRLKPGAMIATQMNGEALKPEHGYPMRAMIPGYIGARSVKWLGKIVVSDRPSENYYMSHSYKLVQEATAEELKQADPLYEYRVNNAICTPSPDTKVPAGKLAVQGYALPTGEPGTTIARVELSTDGGQTWTDAQMTSPAKPFCWRLWKAEVTVTPQTKLILARATDSRGNTQPKDLPWNAKGYMNNGWYRTPVQVAG